MPYHLVPGISYLSFVRFNTVFASPGDYLDGIRENDRMLVAKVALVPSKYYKVGICAFKLFFSYVGFWLFISLY